MGDNKRIDQLLHGHEHKPVLMKIAEKVAKSICKITIRTKDNYVRYGTGFFMKFSDCLKFLITNYHVIDHNTVNENIELEILNNKKMKLVVSNSYIKFYQIMDITIIKINNDNINNNIQFLGYDSNYKKGYHIYNKADIFTIAHPLGLDASCASGTIVEITNYNNYYEFDHNIATDNGSSGCPIILLDNNENLIKVIGIHKNADIEDGISGGTFIGEIIEQLNNDPNLEEIIKRKKNDNLIDIDKNINNINDDLNLKNEYNNINNGKNSNNDKINNKINHEDKNKKENNYNNIIYSNDNCNCGNLDLRNGNKSNEKFNSNNYIIAEININENNINQEIRIINSYEEFKRINNDPLYNILTGFSSADYNNENEIRQCKISINGKLIPFCYLYRFSKLGKNIIKYEFNNLLTKMTCIFCDCESFVSLDLSNFKSQNVFNMFGMLMRRISLKSVNLSNFITTNVRTMRYMFDECKSLPKLDLFGFDTHNVTNMLCMFGGCNNLSYIDLSSFDTQNVEDMSFMFYNCGSLKSLDLFNFNTQKVKNMEYMFGKCNSLTSLNLESFNVKNNAKIVKMFFECPSLKKENVIISNNRIYKSFSGQSEGSENDNNLLSNLYNMFSF